MKQKLRSSRHATTELILIKQVKHKKPDLLFLDVEMPAIAPWTEDQQQRVKEQEKIQMFRPFLYSMIVALAAPITAGVEGATLNGKAVAARMDNYLRPYVAVKDFSGVVLVAQGDKVLYEKAYGSTDPIHEKPNRTSTAFRIASLSKTFTAAAISILAEQGKLSLEDPLSRFLPDFPNAKSITIKLLLRHESGVGQLHSPETLRDCFSTAELVHRIAEVPPLFAPGTSGQYSNEGYILLAAVVEAVSGMDYELFLRQHIFEPLKMEHTGTMCNKWPAIDHSNGSTAGFDGGVAPLPFEQAGWNGPGSVYSTADDLLTWLRALAENRIFRFDQLAYPYGWGKRNYSGRELVEQSGELNGYNAHMALYPKERIYFIFLSNIQSGMFNRLPRDFEAVTFGGTPSTPPLANRVSKSEQKLSEYVGAYTTPAVPMPLSLEEKDGHLWMHWGEDVFERPLLMTGKDEFYLRSQYCKILFERDPQGEIVRSVWQWGDNSPLVLTKKAQP